MGTMEELGWCLECVEQRIQTDFQQQDDDQLPLFCHVLEESSGASVIQVPDRNGSSFRFLLSPLHPSHPASSYIEEYLPCLRDGSGPAGSVIRTLAPLARASSTCSYSLLQQLASDFSSGALEDHVLRPSHAPNPLLPLAPVRHPNLVPVLAFFRSPSSSALYSLLPHTPHTLQSLLHFSPGTLPSPFHITFLFYQLLSAVAYLHSLGVSHLHLSPSNIMLTDSCWLWLPICSGPLPPSSTPHTCPCQGLYSHLKLSPHLDFPPLFHSWWKGELSNFDYLVALSRLAGRRWGDHAFHIIMPWVIDFTAKPDCTSDLGWRDLTKSKWRLAKGDEQLDFTYATSEVPHHLSDECLSDLAVCSYKARRLPLSVLRLAVRSVYEPNEYPSSMNRLYQWTPDECIPEFYCDPRIFYSIHPSMADLAVPAWAASPEDFIKIHRDALESDRVSRNLHHWIDITFGYKMSGEAAVEAKNVMLPSSVLTTPRSVGRRQLFTQPHPPRQLSAGKKNCPITTSAKDACHLNVAEGGTALLSETSYLLGLEEASAFSEHAAHLSPAFGCDRANCPGGISYNKESASEGYERSIFMPPENHPGNGFPSEVNLSYLLEQMELDSSSSMGYQELLLWRPKSLLSPIESEDCGKDIFAVGCVLAELCLMKPLFSSTTLATYTTSGIFPAMLEELPPHTRVIVEACIHTDWTRRPSAKSILESPYFSSTMRSCHLFIAPLQFLTDDGARLEYAANFAKQGTLKAMGTYAAEFCVSYCLPLVVLPRSDTEAEWAYELLREFIRCSTPQGVKTLVLPAIQKILQTTASSHLKVLLLQGSFVQDLWSLIGKQAYLETLHPVVISNLSGASHKSSAATASVLLICTSEELGVPVTVNQTILPLIHCFGKGLCSDGIEALVRIGSLFGETFVVKQMLPLLKRVIRSCIDFSLMNKAEPVQSWSSLALIDCLTTIDGLVAILPGEVVVKELIEDAGCLHVLVLMQTNLDVAVLQVAASTLVAVCQCIGPDLTASHVLPQLKELFYDLAFSQEAALGTGYVGKTFKISRSTLFGEAQIGSRMDLVLFLYPSFASLLGIEKLRQNCATWLLLEQYLFHHHSWKWEHTGEPSRGGSESLAFRRPFKNTSKSEYNPAKLLLNGVGWSIPQSQGSRGGAKIFTPRRQFAGSHQNIVENHMATSTLSNHEPWFWFPTPADSWEGPDFVGRLGNLKDELPWKIRASIIYSIKAHHGALRSLAVSEDESTVYTAGIGPGFKGTVHNWELSRINCVSGYYGHEEVVNDICELSSSGRVASCDGTIHVWNSRTGKAVSVITEPSDDPAHLTTSLSSPSKLIADNSNTLNSNTLLTSTFDGSLYTCMHHLRFSKMIIAGTGNGSIRFIDISQGRKLHLWKGEITEPHFPSLVSAICSCESDKSAADVSFVSPSWIAVGLSSGHCRLFDSRNGSLITSWRAHDGYISKLAAPDRHLLITSSFDRTVRIWDLRSNLPMQTTAFKGHADGVSDFAVWGEDVISISRNKIGISSLWKPAQQEGGPQKLYFADNGTTNLSVLTSIGILPFSRAFVVGTEDGYLRICC